MCVKAFLSRRIIKKIKLPKEQRLESPNSLFSNKIFLQVVTGVRFLKKNKVIQLQIREGTAMAEGQINEKSLRWIEADLINTTS